MSGKMPKEVQCKDIPDQLFLDSVNKAKRPWGVAMLTDVQRELTLLLFYRLMAARDWHMQFVLNVQEKDLVPINLVLAKARKLVKRGLLDGCACGCRGDFKVADEYVLVPHYSLDGVVRYIKYKKES